MKSFIVGTMSGGGSRVMKGRMGSSFVSDVNPQQLSQMEKKLERDTKTAEVCNIIGVLTNSGQPKYLVDSGLRFLLS